MFIKLHIFRNKLLHKEDFVQGMSLESFYNHSEQLLFNTKNLKMLRENIYLPSMRFLISL